MATREPDRRSHPRSKLTCHVKLLDGAARVIPATSIDVSDGGVLLAMANNSLPQVGSAWRVTLAVPRSTPNTYMLEEFLCEGLVVRHQPLRLKGKAAVALHFPRDVSLGLDA